MPAKDHGKSGKSGHGHTGERRKTHTDVGRSSISSAVSVRSTTSKGHLHHTVANKSPLNVKHKGTTVPKGLEPLEEVDRLVIEYIPSLKPIGVKDVDNRYCILNSSGEKIFYAGENVGNPKRHLDSRGANFLRKGNLRNFEITVFDCNGTKVMDGRREAPYAAWCCCCMKDDVHVNHFLGFGNLGSILKDTSFVADRWTIANGFGYPELKLSAPAGAPFCPDIISRVRNEYTLVKRENGEPIGQIFRPRDILSSAGDPVFIVTFPSHTNVVVKALLIFATFLMDAKYFHSEIPRGIRGQMKVR